MKERLGIPKRSTLRQARKVVEKLGLWSQYGKKKVVGQYGDFLYIYWSDTNGLILRTVMPDHSQRGGGEYIEMIKAKKFRKASVKGMKVHPKNNKAKIGYNQAKKVSDAVPE